MIDKSSKGHWISAVGIGAVGYQFLRCHKRYWSSLTFCKLNNNAPRRKKRPKAPNAVPKNIVRMPDEKEGRCRKSSINLDKRNMA